MTTPWYETIRVAHPNIPDSEHEVPKDALFILQRSGWVLAREVNPENQETPPTVEKAEETQPEEPKKSATSSGSKTTEKKGS